MRNNSNNASPEKSSSAPFVVLFLVLAGVVAALFFFGSTLRRLAHESLMTRVTSAHYEILAPADALSAAAMEQFSAQREKSFAVLNTRLEDVASNAKIRIVLDPAYTETAGSASGEQPYSVSGATIRTKLIPQNPSLPAAADAEALLFAVWGKPGNARIARWAAIWLAGEWRGSEIGMAAAEAEQKLGYRNLRAVLDESSNEIASAEDQDLLGAAWISEVTEFGGTEAVHKLYAARMRHPNVASVAKALGTSPPELERTWQMWTYSYLAGMPTTAHGSAMPMKMPMAATK